MPVPFVGLTITLIVTLWLWSWHRRRGSRLELYVGLAIVAAFAVLLGSSLSKVFRSAAIARDRSVCRENLQALGMAAEAYARDYDNRLPLTDWCDCLKGYAALAAFRCPSTESDFGYAMSGLAVGASLDAMASPTTAILWFDGPGGKNRVGGPEAIHRPHLGQATVLYGDFRAERLVPYAKVVVKDGQLALPDKP